jgi:hypothetical protein
LGGPVLVDAVVDRVRRGGGFISVFDGAETT